MVKGVLWKISFCLAQETALMLQYEIQRYELLPS